MAKPMWNLSIYITTLSTEKSVEVNGETHVGTLMLNLVEGLDITADWSDHGLWWPRERRWLLKPRVGLDTHGIQGDAKLQFTPIHKKLRIQKPDLEFIDVAIDFSKPVFKAVQELCSELGMRHPEELSLLKPYDAKAKGDRKPSSVRAKLKKRHSQSSYSSDDNLSSHSDDRTRGSKDSLTPNYGSMGRHGYGAANGNLTPNSPALSNVSGEGGYDSGVLSTSPGSPSHAALSSMYKPKSLQDKAFGNKGWLDSSLCLMEQDVREFDTLLLRFKYYTFFDINPQVDEDRIGQLYEQAKVSILTEDVECTDEEMMTFSAIQFQVKLCSSTPQNNPPVTTDEADDIDLALSGLQASLEGSTFAVPTKNLTHVPEIKDYLNMVKHKTFGTKKKKMWFVFKETSLTAFKSQEDSNSGPTHRANLRGSDVTPEVNVSKDKFNIKLRFQDGEDMELACSSEGQYAKWMAAFRLASKGKTMADSSYETEVSGIQAFLSMQHGKGDSTPLSPGQFQIQPEDFVSPRMLKKYKPKQIAARILEAHSSLNKASLIDSKTLYIRQWQSLPEFGVTHFIVKFNRADKISKKDEILGITFNRIMRIDPGTKEAVKTWRYSVMKAWNVNWETREMIVQCEGETIAFTCKSADIKVIHEFIGGYIFLSMRKDVNKPPDEELFFKLTGGWR